MGFHNKPMRIKPRAYVMSMESLHSLVVYRHAPRVHNRGKGREYRMRYIACMATVFQLTCQEYN